MWKTALQSIKCIHGNMAKLQKTILIFFGYNPSILLLQGNNGAVKLLSKSSSEDFVEKKPFDLISMTIDL